MFFFSSFNNYVSLRYIQLNLGNSCHLLAKELPARLAICSFCVCLTVFVCLSLWCSELDAELVVSVPAFSYLLSHFTIGKMKIYSFFENQRKKLYFLYTDNYEKMFCIKL